MSRLIFGALLVLAGLAPSIRADEKPASIMARIQIISIRDSSLSPTALTSLTSERWTEKELEAFVKTMKAEGSISVLAAPVLTIFSGQKGVVESGGQSAPFVTAVKPQQINGQTVYLPEQTRLFLGTGITVKATNLVANNAISLEVRAEFTQLDGPVGLVPVTIPVNPVGGNGKPTGDPIAFTQYIEQPKIQRITTQGATKLSSGETYLMVSDKFTVETRTEYGPPVLSDIPYVNRFFKNVGYGRETRRLLIAVTPEIVECKNASNAATVGDALGALIDASPKSRPTPDCAKRYVNLEEAIRLAQANGQPDSPPCDTNSGGFDCPRFGFYKPMPTGGLVGGILLNTSTPPTPPCASSPAKSGSSESMTLADIVALTASGMSDEIILNQIRTVKATFTLGTEQLIWLKSQKVSDAVILQMQNTRLGSPPAPNLLSIQPKYDSDPNYRMRQMLNESENLRNAQEEIHRFWMNQQPSGLTYDRLNGAIGPD